MTVTAPGPGLQHVSCGHSSQTSRGIPKAKSSLSGLCGGTHVDDGRARPLEEAARLAGGARTGAARGAASSRRWPGADTGDPQGAARGASAPGDGRLGERPGCGDRVLVTGWPGSGPAHNVIIHEQEQTGGPRRLWSDRSGGAGWGARVQQPVRGPHVPGAGRTDRGLGPAVKRLTGAPALARATGTRRGGHRAADTLHCPRRPCEVSDMKMKPWFPSDSGSTVSPIRRARSKCGDPGCPSPEASIGVREVCP